MSVDDGLYLAVALGRDDGGDAAMLQIGEDGVGVVALVAEQDDRDRQTQAVGPQMDLAREATSRAPTTFAPRACRFFWAPAACWWARTMVESIIWTLS